MEKIIRTQKAIVRFLRKFVRATGICQKMLWTSVGSEYSFWDSSKAVEELGMPQTPIRESIQNAIDWFKENGYL